MLTKLLVKCYTYLMEIFAWFFLIQAGIIGAMLGYFFANKIIGNGEFLYSFLGGLIFIVIAFLIESAIIPFFVILFKIYDILCENLPAKGKTEALTLVERINNTERSDNIKVNKDETPMVSCSFCGENIEVSDRVCPKCGSKNELFGVQL
ncbi:zinc ribbon domain-containing protein [Treponema pedis]|uniref:zinc ribbon domain-containing protein n=1 Tax=Treponema pedis TaxID=409322 RepID=UPI000464CBD2|nr:zinc ribbon domain-containing protein [Treponema pedis]